jgi:hypothetical protein
VRWHQIVYPIGWGVTAFSSMHVEKLVQLDYSGQTRRRDETGALPRTAEAAVWWIASVVKEAGFITVVPVWADGATQGA